MIQLRAVEEKDTAFIEAVYRTTREADLLLTNWSEIKKVLLSKCNQRPS